MEGMSFEERKVMSFNLSFWEYLCFSLLTEDWPLGVVTTVFKVRQ